MNVEVKDYEALYTYIFKEACNAWAHVTRQTEKPVCELRRVYWYAVGSIDNWDLTIPQSQTALRTAFSREKDVRDSWLAITGKAHPELRTGALEDKAWAACFNDFKDWYETKQSILAGMRDFHQGLRIKTDLIDVIESGHWKVNFLHKLVEEKGLDTALAADMLALQDNYDVAVIVSGDADSIPSIDHLKCRNKHVTSLEFMNGSPPESKGRTFSSRLKEHADFVIRIYETELLRLKIGSCPAPKSAVKPRT